MKLTEKYSDHPKKISRLCAPFCGGCLRYQTKEAQTGKRNGQTARQHPKVKRRTLGK